MRHGSLFSGIGGFDLASEWMGWENVFHCEWNEFGQKVLKYYWPNAITYNDITKTDFTIHRGKIDILTGGFPCQPYSMAGKRKGKEDERHLWPEMLRAIREIQPAWVVGENVLGLVNWDGGLVFEEVQADLEAQGYKVQPYVLPAASVNAPHRRDRVWFVAYSDHKGRSARPRQVQGENGEVSEWHNDAKPSDSSIQSNASNSECIGLDISLSNRQISEEKRNESKEWNKSSISSKTNGCRFKPNWDNFPTSSPICTRDDGISDRLDSITFPKWRNESIKAGGNAIVPQVVYQIFKAIEQYNNLNK
jgi:DNA (cytosine-5)-methyltransferase 1